MRGEEGYFFYLSLLTLLLTPLIRIHIHFSTCLRNSAKCGVCLRLSLCALNHERTREIVERIFLILLLPQGFVSWESIQANR